MNFTPWIQILLCACASLTLSYGVARQDRLKPGDGGLSKLTRAQKERIIHTTGATRYMKGDMALTREQYIDLFGVDPESPGSELSKRSAITSKKSFLWPDGVVPYENDLSEFSEADKAELQVAIAFLQEETCIKFRPRETSWWPWSGDKSWISIQSCTGKEDGCWTWLGNVDSGKHPVCLSDGCRYLGTMMHELGHMLGLYHEHERSDRDYYIKVHWDRISRDDYDQFEKAFEDEMIRSKLYDFNSIMHYERSSFPEDGRSNTISAVNPEHNEYITPVRLRIYSYYDIFMLNMAYKCAERCSSESKKHCTNGYLNSRCECVSLEAYYRKYCVDKPPPETARPDDCPRLKRTLTCDGTNWQFSEYENHSWEYWMARYCRKTCNRC